MFPTFFSLGSVVYWFAPSCPPTFYNKIAPMSNTITGLQFLCNESALVNAAHIVLTNPTDLI